MDHIIPRSRCSKCGAIGSQDTGVVLQPCSSDHCKDVLYCSLDCRQAHRTAHRWPCTRGSISGRAQPLLLWTSTEVPPQRPIADRCAYTMIQGQGKDIISPTSELIGVPLVFSSASCAFDDSIWRRLGYDTYAASTVTILFLLAMDVDNLSISDTICGVNIKAENLDTIAVRRQDNKLLTPETLETVLEFLFMLVQEFADASARDGWAPMKEYLTPRAFQMFSKRYFREQREKGRDGFDGPFVPL